MKFKIGDKVIYTSGQYGSDFSNPLHKDNPEVFGLVTKIEQGYAHSIRVSWSSGTENSYIEKDLEFAEQYKNNKVKFVNGIQV